jgi:hypothetical protein
MNQLWSHRRTACALALSVAFLAMDSMADDRKATAAFESKPIAANAPFEIALAGPDSPGFAVMLDKLDISGLFERTPGKLRYHGRGPSLPAGDRTITVFDIDAAGTWTQVGQFPIRLLSPRGFVSTKFEPTGDITGKGQVAEEHTPFENAPERSQFQDATTQLGLRTELVRPAFTTRAEMQVSGVTNQNEALRFSSEGTRAPRIDLSGYRIELQRGTTVLSLGHVSVGAQRHLINGFNSRGVSLKVGEGRPVSVEVAALNGSSIVGWNNPIGLERDRHRIYSATVGVELRPQTPGLLRVETGLFQGSSQPLTSFNQGGIVTAEKSRGGTLRLVSNAWAGRLRVDGGYTESRFDEAFDAQVEEGLIVTPLEGRTSSARYADVSVDLLQNRTFGKRSVTLTLNLRHEAIQPQFRSLGAQLQADLRTNSAEAAFSIGSVTGTAAARRLRDNLGGLDTILTTNTDVEALTFSIPVGTMLTRDGVTPKWAPTISVQAEANHQFGEGLPPGFTIDSVPDRMAWNLQTSAEWQVGTWRVGGRFGRTLQDDRQFGREAFDVATNTGAFTFDWSPSARFGFGGELGMDRNRTDEQLKTDSTFRWAARSNWTVWREVALAGTITNIRAWDDLDSRDAENIDSSIELSSGFKLSRADKRKGRIFVRWVDRRGDTFDRIFGLRDKRGSSALATGLTLSMF